MGLKAKAPPEIQGTHFPQEGDPIPLLQRRATHANGDGAKMNLHELSLSQPPHFPITFTCEFTFQQVLTLRSPSISSFLSTSHHL